MAKMKNILINYTYSVRRLLSPWCIKVTAPLRQSFKGVRCNLLRRFTNTLSTGANELLSFFDTVFLYQYELYSAMMYMTFQEHTVPCLRSAITLDKWFLWSQRYISKPIYFAINNFHECPIKGDSHLNAAAIRAH